MHEIVPAVDSGEQQLHIAFIALHRILVAESVVFPEAAARLAVERVAHRVEYGGFSRAGVAADKEHLSGKLLKIHDRFLDVRPESHHFKRFDRHG